MALAGGAYSSDLLDDATLQHTSFFLDARSIVAVARSCRAAHRLCGSEELLKWVGSVRHHALPGMHCAEQLRLAEALDSVASTLEFEWGSTAIAQSSLPALGRLADLLVRHPAAAVKVEGHCGVDAPDFVAVRFSESRADAVADALRELLGTRGEGGGGASEEEEEEEEEGEGERGAGQQQQPAPPPPPPPPPVRGSAAPRRTIATEGFGKSRAKVARGGYREPEQGGDPNRRVDIFLRLGGAEFPPRASAAAVAGGVGAPLVDCSREGRGARLRALVAAGKADGTDPRLDPVVAALLEEDRQQMMQMLHYQQGEHWGEEDEDSSSEDEEGMLEEDLLDAELHEAEAAAAAGASSAEEVSGGEVSGGEEGAGAGQPPAGE